jgi:hypothetical protein
MGSLSKRKAINQLKYFGAGLLMNTQKGSLKKDLKTKEGYKFLKTNQKSHVNQ